MYAASSSHLRSSLSRRHAGFRLARYARRSITSTGALRNDPVVPDATKGTPAETAETRKGKEVEHKDSTDPLDAEKKTNLLPFLPRPLGVKDRPTTIERTWTEEMMDDETRKSHREKLLKAATKGYFHDMNATRKHGGKTWIAPRVLIREDKALYFPDISGTPLNGNQKVHTTDMLLGKVSVISMLTSKISEIQTHMFVEPTDTKFAKNPLYQHIQINLQENLFKSLLVSLFAGSIRGNVPETQWSKYLISSQNMDYLRDDMGLMNRHVGYVYLVDAACRIRWAGCADPKPEEIEALQVCTEVLLKRHEASRTAKSQRKP